MNSDVDVNVRVGERFGNHLLQSDRACVAHESNDGMSNLQQQRWTWRAFLESINSRYIASLGLAIAIGVSYFFAAWLSLGLLTKPDGVAVFWPAAGLSSGALIALGSGWRLPVTLGVLAVATGPNTDSHRAPMKIARNKCVGFRSKVQRCVVATAGP